MTLQQQLEQYDLQPGDLIEFTDGEIWLYRGNDANSLTCLKGSYDISLSLSRWDYGCEHLEGKTIKRVMRTDWTFFDCRTWLSAGEPMLRFIELKPKPRKKLVTVELEPFALEPKVGDSVCMYPHHFGGGKVVEVREK